MAFDWKFTDGIMIGGRSKSCFTQPVSSPERIEIMPSVKIDSDFVMDKWFMDMALFLFFFKLVHKKIKDQKELVSSSRNAKT